MVQHEHSGYMIGINWNAWLSALHLMSSCVMYLINHPLISIKKNTRQL